MKKTTLILGALILFSGSAYACPGEHSGKVSFHNHKQVNFSASKHSDSSNIKSATVFSVKGMTCNTCVQKVETAIKSIKGVKTVKVDLKTAKANVVFISKSDEKNLSEKITKAVEKSGFKASKV